MMDFEENYGVKRWPWKLEQCRKLNNHFFPSSSPLSFPPYAKKVPADAPAIMCGNLVLLDQCSGASKKLLSAKKQPKVAPSASSIEAPPNRASSTSRWFSLQPDFVLYSFPSRSARRALTSTPVPGCAVVSGAEDPEAVSAASTSAEEAERTVKMFFRHNLLPSSSSSSGLGREYYFLADTPQEARRYQLWIDRLPPSPNFT